MSGSIWFDVALAVLGGAIRIGTPFLFVSLGECLTEKSGRINLGLEGVLVLSAMAGFGGSYLSGSPWIGVLVAGGSGALLALLHGLLCSLPRVSDIATGIALMLLGAGLAFYLGKPLIQPQAAQIPSLDLGAWSDSPQVQAALRINALFPLGVVLALLLAWALANTRWGLIVRMAGDSSDAARALGYSVNTVRVLSTTLGGFIAGMGGASLTGAIPLEFDRELPTPHEPRRLVRDGERMFHQLWTGTEWADCCEFTLNEMFPIDCEVANWWTSASPASHFKARVVVGRAGRDGTRKAIRGGEFTHRRGAEILASEAITSAPQLLALLATHFDLPFPAGTDFRPTAP